VIKPVILQREELHFSLGQRNSSGSLRFQPLPLLVCPHLQCRFRRIDDLSNRTQADLLKSIPITTVVAELAVGMENWLAALGTLLHELGAAPHTEMLTFGRKGEITALRADSILMGMC
jgi:hypothetical protein